jgi:hypothetical protein
MGSGMSLSKQDEQIERVATSVAEAMEAFLRPALVAAIDQVPPRSTFHFTEGYVNAILAAIPDPALLASQEAGGAATLTEEQLAPALVYIGIAPAKSGEKARSVLRYLAALASKETKPEETG